MEQGPAGSSAATGGAQGTVFIRTLTGSVGAVDVRWDDSGEDLKRKVIEENIHPGDVDGLRLIFKGKHLEDARSLRHQGLTNHCTLHVVRRLRGGGDISSLPPVCDFPAVTAQGREEAQPPHSSSPDKEEPEEQTREARRAVAACRYSAVLKGKCKRCIGKILPEVTPEIVPGTEENRTVYRARIPSAGSFRCSETGLGFEVSAAVTVEYEYGSWAESLSPSARQEWMVAGPLFHIRAEPDTVRAVHLPHFVCLADGGDLSSCQIAHFEAGHMTLETPTRIHLFHVVLENPSFSQLGVLWRKIRSTVTFIPIHSLVLIYRALRAADITLHLYLIPNDHSLRKAIEEEETKWESKLVPKPPQTSALYFGSQYEVSGTSELKITPDHLELCYRSPADQQSYIELYMTAMEEEIKLHMKDRKDGKLVWKTFVRPGDVQIPAASSQTLPARGESFVRKHREQLRRRMGVIYPILARLRDIEAMNSDEEEEVLSMQNKQKVMNEALLQLVERKGARAQEELYQSLRETDPYLVQDLEQSS
ncbi:caspase recruitment domain-containing protein 8-like isoform X2 [Malaclemys terrapin pileata]|uniref:caspase recruitment domain-containing protein 8-like isoform X2 n=1 Tax=Malaclemys terrapin pileata TaxID=2991368 RepID=UPI0023A910CC|nr:caspase recruitment domain-containing protein 8-like isoform X2 [Malaclemys terrapin pileata]